MKRLLFVFLWVLLGATFVFGAWYVLHGDIQYTSDVARDFLLLHEISQKGIVLIGPSSSTKLFHGILWMYLNYPVYALSGGNPVVSGWFWVFLSMCSVFGGFYVAKKLFTLDVAYVYALIYALFLAFHVRYFYNPDGVMLVIPFVFYFFIEFLKTKKIKFLVFHLLIVGAMVQFEMAIGIPFALLSFGYVLYKTIKWKKYIHLLTFLIIPLTQLNFIIFDLRHDFLISKLVYHFLTSAGRDKLHIFSMIWQRIIYLMSTVEFSRINVWNINTIIMIVIFVAIFLQIRAEKNVQTYALFLYFYLGFFVLSMANAGGLLYFYVYPLFPLVFLIFASLITSRIKVLIVLLLFVTYLTNMVVAATDMYAEANLFAGKTADSWLFFNNLAQKVFTGPEKSFGYFVFDPDVVAYQSKYVLLYEQHVSSKDVAYFKKEPITYLVIAYNTYGQDLYWKQQQLHITASPSATIAYDNGYKVEKFQLLQKDIQTPVEPNLDPGLMFR